VFTKQKCSSANLFPIEMVNKKLSLSPNEAVKIRILKNKDWKVKIEC
jgi:hypothetical protein